MHTTQRQGQQRTPKKGKKESHQQLEPSIPGQFEFCDMI